MIGKVIWKSIIII